MQECSAAAATPARFYAVFWLKPYKSKGIAVVLREQKRAVETNRKEDFNIRDCGFHQDFGLERNDADSEQPLQAA